MRLKKGRARPNRYCQYLFVKYLLISISYIDVRRTKVPKYGIFAETGTHSSGLEPGVPTKAPENKTTPQRSWHPGCF